MSTASAFTLTDAFHSLDGRRRASLPRRAVAASSSRSSGGPTIYFAGDTCVFGDMQLIRRLYEPDVAVLPIGDHFTMGPREAAVALELLGTPRCIPCHCGTFPLLAGTPDELRQLAPDGVEILAPEPGETIDAVRQRWFGATGRRVPEIALEGDEAVPLDEALVLDASRTRTRCARRTRRARRSSCARAPPTRCARRWRDPEVACALVPESARELLELDLPKLTYG